MKQLACLLVTFVILGQVTIFGTPTDDLDLPIIPPIFGEERETLNPLPAADADDPTDEPPPTFFGEEIAVESNSIIYVLDVSCSMVFGGYNSYVDVDDDTIKRGNSFTRAKNELIRSVRSLSRNFSFNVVIYSCPVGAWMDGMQEATTANKQAAEAWIMLLEVGSSTATGAGVAYALESEPTNKMIVLLTDGAPGGCGFGDANDHRAMIRSANRQGAQIDVFGMATHGRFKLFCQMVASENGGKFHDVP